MRRLPVSEMKNGMILAKEILDEKGRVLLKKGDPLREAYIHKLGDWGISEVCVETPDEDQPESADERNETSATEIVVPLEITEKYERILDAKFSEFPTNVMMNTIKRAAVRNLALKQARRFAEA